MSGLGFLDGAARQAACAADVSRRPWPLPAEPWVQAETREEIVLAHWAVPAAELTRFVPPELELDRFGGETWLGLVAFRVCHLRLRGLPPLPGLSSLLEFEIRTYVTDGVRPGIWLLTLDATNRLLVEAAKRVQRLPAYAARIELESAGDTFRLDVQRDGLRLSARFEADGPPAPVEPASLDHFLCERYALYTSDGGRLYRAELHHSPWSLREAHTSVGQAGLVPVPLDGTACARIASSHELLVWAPEEL